MPIVIIQIGFFLSVLDDIGAEEAGFAAELEDDISVHVSKRYTIG
jgi:hypothetical protein